MKNPVAKQKVSKSNLASRTLPAIFAVGSSLATLPASALQLGEATVQSRLGQPLRASIAYALGPNEQISAYCVTMRPGASVSGLPGFGAATISVANGVILLTGSTPVREPMVSAHVIVNCPHAANLTREYMLFIDPLSPSYDKPVVTQQVKTVAEPVVVPQAAVSRPVSSVSPPPVVKDVQASSTYTVRPNDTLSGIAARIQDRPIKLWPAVNQIFEANPDAFIGNDINRLKAGSVLAIPDFNGKPSIVTPSPAVAATVVEIAEVSAVIDDTSSVLAAYDTNAVEIKTGADSTGIVDASVSEQPAAVILGESPDAAVIFDANVEGPTTNSASPNVPTAIIPASSDANEGLASNSWLLWLAGSGIAIIFALLMFGRRFRGDTVPAPLAPAAEQNFGRRFSDMETTDTENVEAISVDFDLSDDSPTEENLALDADLIVGTGLAVSEAKNEAHDFAFAETGQVDIELPFEPEASSTAETDMLPPLRTDEASILDSEILPEDVDDDYDMSVIVDATKMPQPEDVTERDLRAVEVTPDDDTLIAQNYTISKEVDYQVLEQDYEDELTATQLLNQEIARAAAEMTEKMTDNSDVDGDLTAALPLATVTELDITAQMPAQNDEISDDDATGTSEVITVNLSADDDTIEMPTDKVRKG